MSVTIPTVAAIRAQIVADIEGRIGTAVPILPKAFVRVLAVALAGLLSGIYRYAAWVYKQIFPATADEAALILKGEEYGVTRLAAVRWDGTATATGTAGTLIPSGTLWTLAGLVYSQKADATIAGGGSIAVSLECLTAGIAGNPDALDEFAIVTPLADVDSTAVYLATVIEGEDEEDIEDYRTRVLERIREQPQGGAAADYVGWAREVAGVVKAFAFRTGAGYVTVYPLQAVTGVSRIPAAGKITEVQDYVGAVERRPMCANVLAAAMDELGVDFTITGLDPTDADTQDAIESALQTYLYAAYPLQYPDEPGATNIVSVAAAWAIIAAAGATASAVTMLVDGNPATAYTLADDEIVTLGTVTWA